MNMFPFYLFSPTSHNGYYPYADNLVFCIQKEEQKKFMSLATGSKALTHRNFNRPIER